MNWNDTGIIISMRKHGDNNLILNVLTENHGLHSGYIRNKISKNNRYIYQMGNVLFLTWTGRLEEHLGYYRCELLHSFSHKFLNNVLTLNALNSFCELHNSLLPEREMYKNLFSKSIKFLKLVDAENTDWISEYIRWELILLSELGYGLDLTSCAVTGINNDLHYVSPKTGRAVSTVAAGKWKNKLLVLPHFLVSIEKKVIDKKDILNGIELTSFFLKKYLFTLDLKLPISRDRFINELKKLEI